jgi:hypothetical protein
VDDLAGWLTQVWDEQEKREAGRYRPREGMDLAEASATDDGGMFIRWERGGRPEFLSREEYVSQFLEPAPDPFILARIAADRQILARCQRIIGMHKDGGPLGELAMVVEVRLMLLDLVQPYADRPGFRDEWRRVSS